MEELQNDMDGRESEHCELQGVYELCLEQNQLLVRDKNTLIIEVEEMRERVMDSQYRISHLTAEVSTQIYM